MKRTIMPNKVAVITVIYKFPQKKVDVLIQQLTKQGISKKDIYIKDNTNDNIGYASAINTILRKILNKYDYFFIINPDLEIEKNCLSELLEVFKKDKKAGIVGPRSIKDNTYIDGGSLDRVRYSSILKDQRLDRKKTKELYKEVTYVSGSAMLIKKEVFKKIGLLKEDYFLYYEETDFCLRARKAGFKMLINPEAIVKHRESETVGKESPAMDYYMARNHLLFLERFAPWYVKIHELLRLPKTLYQARKRKYELLGIRDYFLRRFGRNSDIKNKVDL